MNVNVEVAESPFSRARRACALEAGETVEDMVLKAQPDAFLRRHAQVFLNGHYIARDNWARVKPKPGAALYIHLVPMGGGGGGKDPLRMILAIALTAAVPVAAGGLNAALGLTGTILGRVVTGGLGILGRLALNAIAPPAAPRFSGGGRDSPTLFIQGARNEARPFGRVPRVLGRHRFVPPMGALPYTETAGAEQYLRLLFVWGYGPLNISDLKIGETPLSKFEGVEIETRQGYADDDPLTLYSNSVLQNDLGAELTQEDGFVLRTTEADADEISVDITLPRGLVKFAGASKLAAKVQVEIQYAPAGTEDWSAGAGEYKVFEERVITLPAPPAVRKKQGVTEAALRTDQVAIDNASGKIRVVKGLEYKAGEDAPALPPLPEGSLLLALVDRATGTITDKRENYYTGTSFETDSDFLVTAHEEENKILVAAGGLRFGGIEISAKQTSALRKTVTFKVDKGHYDVRLRRVTDDAEEDNTSLFDATVWTALRTIRYAYPVNMQGLAMTALRIKATGQLNGVIDRFNGVVESILPDWDGDEWRDQPTSNPASLFRHVLQGSANARPLADSRIDLEKLQQWHGRCTDAAREYNGVIDYDVSVREVLHEVAAAGRASPGIVDGKWTVVGDRAQAVPVQHFTPRNTFNFEGRKAFAPLPQALRVRFINRDKGWVQDERIVYDDGYDAVNTTDYETLSLPGVTSPEQAWKDGRYHIATARLRPETYSFSCDLEHIVCTRGDLIRFSHDVPMFGLCSARIKSATTTTAVLDEEIYMQAGKSYALRVRRADGASAVIALQTVEGKSKTVTFAAAEDNAPEAGDLALFGEAGMESVELLVKSVTPQGNLQARLTCVDAAPAVHVADTGTIPAFSSQMTVPPELQRPPVPVLADIQSGQEALIRNTDGSLTTRIIIALAPPAFIQPLSIAARVRAQDETQFRPADILTEGNNRISIADVEEGETYDIELRHASPAGVFSLPLVVTGHRVEGASAVPADVENLSVSVLGDTAHLAWARNTDLDLSHYTLRYSPLAENVTWSSAVDIVARIAPQATSLSLPAAPGTYLLKAVDIGGRQSAAPAMAVTAITEAPGQNAVMEVTESPVFAGVKTNVARRDSALQLCGRDSIDDWADFDVIPNCDIGLEGLSDEGLYEFAAVADLGAVYTSRLTALLEVDGADLNESLDSWDNLDNVEFFDQDTAPSPWTLQLQLRSTQDDPEDDPAWSGWTDFIIGDYTARAFQFRLKMAAHSANISPSISALSVTIDMPDRVVSANNQLSMASGNAITFARAFRAVPAITVTPHDMATGDYYTLTTPAADGFGLRFFDSAGTGVARHFDYIARGYGEEI
jgi:hypothetical protein